MFLLKFRKTLLHSYPFYLVLIGALLFTFLNTVLLPTKTTLTGTETKISGILEEYKIDGNHLRLKIKYKKEFVVGHYYFELKEQLENFEKQVTLGDKIEVKGNLQLPKESRVENGFCYRTYLKNEKTFYLMNVEYLQIISQNKNIYYMIKNKIKQKMKKAIKSQRYLETFILGETSNLDQVVVESFRRNGISHLFAISGMHISLISTILISLFKKIGVGEKKRYQLVSMFLLFYLILTFSPSVLRATLFFILFSINKYFYFYIKSFHIYLLTLSICLFINPYFIYSIGFQYSFLISGALILAENYINKGKNYFNKLLKTSLLSFFTSSIITIYHFYELNFLSILYNLFFVPLISYLIFPLSLLTFIFPILDSVLALLILLLEKVSLFLANLSFGNIILGRPNGIFITLYILIFIISLWEIQKRKILPFYLYLPLFLGQFLSPMLENNSYLMMFDVGQGESILLKSKQKTMLIDTGGIKHFRKEGFKSSNYQSLVDQITIPYLKSKGIRQIDILILTHGDYDHLGEAETIIKKFKVKKIYINNNKMNNLEKNLKLKRKVEKLGPDEILQLGDVSLYSLNDDLKEENDSSIILLASVKNIKILLMGDASCKTEKSILKKYNLPKIDILKVGHHGSKTSSCDMFLNEVDPSFAIISAGENNKFHHPHKIILERFQKRGIKYFITSKQGSIKIPLIKT